MPVQVIEVTKHGYTVQLEIEKNVGLDYFFWERLVNHADRVERRRLALLLYEGTITQADYLDRLDVIADLKVAALAYIFTEAPIVIWV
jgi:hypothetical protein